MVVFCLSAFIAAVGGAVAAVGQGNATPDSYPPLLSLTYFTLVIISAVNGVGSSLKTKFGALNTSLK